VDRIDRSFFETDPLTCAQAMIGCELSWTNAAGIIVETEAYAATGDEAAHTFLRRSARMFVEERPPGSLYVYLNYGLHWLLNFLVIGSAANGFVLIRALRPTKGIDLMRARRGVTAERSLCSGPGKLTQALAIDGSFHGKDLFALPGVEMRAPRRAAMVETDLRVGITKSAELEWRFLLEDSPFASIRKNKTRPRTF
jgi:DNA-3-methyladenine glycosylase